MKRIFRYLKGQPKLGLWYAKDLPFDLIAYTDSDYAGASLDRKSTTGGCQFLRCRLISWQCKKQTVLANSITEAEYIYIDNESTICIVKNPVFHSKIKHIEIRHHFIRYSNEKKLIQMIKMHTDKNVAALLTKAFDLLLLGYLLLASLKKRVKKLERKRKSKTAGMKRLFKIGRSAQVVSSEDEGLGSQEDASKQERKIDDIDQDTKVTLVDETQGSEKVVEEAVSTVEVSSTATITTEEITLAQALAELRSAKPKVVVQEPVQSTTTTAPSTIPRAKIVFHEQEQAPTPIVSSQQLTHVKDKAEEEEQARLVREKAEKVEEANISWDNVQAMIEANRLLAEIFQTREQVELTDEEKARLFVELLEKRKKHFAALRAQEKRNKPPTKAQKKSTMLTYLKHMAGYKQSQLKNKSFVEIQKLFDKAMTRVNMFIDIDIELVKESSKKAEAKMAKESSSKRAGEELEQEIHRKGRQRFYEIMRADGSAKTYLFFSQLLKEFDREDLENLWKLVKVKHGNTRPDEGYESVLWGDLKTMFEHHIEDLIWRNLQGKKVLLWRLYDLCGVHFVRFKDMHVYMLVEKRDPLTPATITDMLNKKLKSDY
ncbi:hypothetical protein Tco_1180284 [Tanacetum coccineum]